MLKTRDEASGNDMVKMEVLRRVGGREDLIACPVAQGELDYDQQMILIILGTG